MSEASLPRQGHPKFQKGEFKQPAVVDWWQSGERIIMNNYGIVNKGKEKISEIQISKGKSSSELHRDFSNVYSGKEKAGFGAEVMLFIKLFKES